MLDQASRTKIHAHDSALGAWRISELAPTETFAPFVSRMFAYSERDTGFTRRREPPNGLAALVFNLGAELRVEHPLGVCSAFGAGAAFYTGLSHAHAVTETERAQAGAQAFLTPLGARRLLGFPLGEIGDLLIDPGDLLGCEAREVTERLQEANSHERRLAILERFLQQRFAAPAKDIPRDLVWALARMKASAGAVRIAALAAEIECSRKSLTERFTREFGMAPKPFTRVLRFDRALRMVKAGRIVNWAELAGACGYADQAHLSRDFRAFAGSPPAALLARALPERGGFRD